MYIYKLTCSKTGKVYYGATRKDPKIRVAKGHSKCACRDFVNKKLEIVEQDIQTEEEMFEREKYYIKNFDCVNVLEKKNSYTKEYVKNYNDNYRENNKDIILKHRIEGLKPIQCPICNKQTSKFHLNRHQNTNYCKKIKSLSNENGNDE
tara:strand:+ start:2652 stop:3098 length:447 start_codon:yes stop_codon:yes gene_type:complete